MPNASYTFISSPYSSGLTKGAYDQIEWRSRYEETVRFTAWCVRQHIHVFSPIVHSHPLAERYALPKDAEFWRAYNRLMLSHASDLFVLSLPGWRASSGVRDEVAFATDLGLPIKLAHKADTHDDDFLYSFATLKLENLHG